MFEVGNKVNKRGTVEAQLQRWASQLHDLSGRNRLLYYHETRSSSATIEYPTFDELFRSVVERGQTLTAPLPAYGQDPGGSADRRVGAAIEMPELSDLLPEIPSIDDDGPVEIVDVYPEPAQTGHDQQNVRGRSGRSARKNEILTRLSIPQLNRVLYNLRYAARTIREEQGLNILYMTFGMLRWRERRSPAWSQAPLLLVPMSLDRDRPNLPWRMRMEDGETVVNPVLQIKLLKDFGLQLPDQLNELSVAELRRFLEDARARIASTEGWEVEERATLGAFSFLNLLLIRDFENHGALYARHPLVRWLAGLHPKEPEPLKPVPEASDLDELVHPGTVFQVLDADSSQQEAIEAAKRGLSFILQGPPGTGKSQTITNLIAESIMAGKKVLFVSQKMAALEVVQQRLARKGLAEFCLEIHSHRMDKRRVVQELMTSLAATTLKVANPHYETGRREIGEIRHELNDYVKQLHTRRPELGLSLYELHGRLAQVLDAPRVEFGIPAVESISSSQLSQMLRAVRELSGYAEELHRYSSSPWYGYAAEYCPIEERERLTRSMQATSQSIRVLDAEVGAILRRFDLRPADQLADVLELAHVLTCFEPEIFSRALEGAVLRYRGHGLSNGRFMSLQYGSDAEKLEAALRDERRASTRELAMAIATVARFVREARRAAADEPEAPTGRIGLTALDEHLRQIESGYAEARAIFRTETMPTVLKEVYRQSPAEAAEWFSVHADLTPELPKWASLNAACSAARASGLADFADQLLRAGLPSTEIEPAFSRRFYELLIERLTVGLPMFARFSGASHTERIRRFRKLDEEMIERASNEIQVELYRSKPQRSWMNAGSAETSVLRREHNKKRRLKPLRKLFLEIPNLMQTLKPCLMMSPLTVCQLLDPSVHQFDLVVFDEASQIPPEYAVGAFLRGRQVVIAGDRQQLPPMDFFQAMEGGQGLDEEDQGDDESEYESILTLCDSRGFPSKMLNWHYRSRDESLIAYSNQHFYEGRLLTFPSSRVNNPATGLKYIFVEDGVYEPGEAARYNRREASRVAELTLQLVTEHPTLSLGIVAFGAPQRRAIEAAMDRLRIRNPAINGLFRGEGEEPIFIKNLENVQGDERDVIILSVGYGRDRNGRFAMNFGPLNRDGGARRLNVAVTRARHLLYLVASIQPEDIDLGRANSRGAALLRDYLLTARDGIRQATPGAVTPEDHYGDSDFEDSVFQALSAQGLDVARRVGASEYRIDLAIRDPREPGHFLLGLECDGRTYRQAMTARDRDRLREKVMEGLGWKIHRIWSQDWIRDRDDEIRKVMQRVQALLEDPAGGPDVPRGGRVSRAGTVDRSRTDGALDSEHALPAGASLYSASTLAPPSGKGKAALLGAPMSELVDELQTLANQEGPLSVSIAKTKIMRLWQARADDEVGDRLDSALRAGTAQGAFRLNGDFLWPLGLQVAPLRIHPVGSPRRAIEEIAPEEIAEALRACVKGAITISRSDLIREVARLFGRRASVASAARIEAVLDNAIQQGQLSENQGRIGSGDVSAVP